MARIDVSWDDLIQKAASPNGSDRSVAVQQAQSHLEKYLEEIGFGRDSSEGSSLFHRTRLAADSRKVRLQFGLKEVIALRNRIAHDGYEPTAAEASHAVALYQSAVVTLWSQKSQPPVRVAAPKGGGMSQWFSSSRPAAQRQTPSPGRMPTFPQRPAPARTPAPEGAPPDLREGEAPKWVWWMVGGVLVVELAAAAPYAVKIYQFGAPTDGVGIFAWGTLALVAGAIAGHLSIVTVLSALPGVVAGGLLGGGLGAAGGALYHGAEGMKEFAPIVATGGSVLGGLVSMRFLFLRLLLGG